MDSTLLMSVVLAVIVGGVLYLFVFRSRGDSSGGEPRHFDPNRAANTTTMELVEETAENSRRGGRNYTSTGRGGDAAGDDQEEKGEEAPHDPDEEGEDDHDDEELKGLSRLQKKKLLKQREKQEKQRQLQNAIETRQKAREETDKMEEEEKIREQLKEELEEQAVEQLRLEKKEKEDEEYKKWVGEIAVEEKGVVDLDEGERKLNVFLESLPQHETEYKVIVLSEVAKEHGVSADTVADKLEKLVQQEKVDGVFDDRGKFILVNETEYKAIAKFINGRGRVSQGELVRECNRVIDLHTTPPTAAASS